MHTQMKQFIAKCRNADERMKTFERVYDLSQVQRSPYHYMKAWFLDNYANYDAQPTFDEDGFVIVKTNVEMLAEKATEGNVAEAANNVVDIASAEKKTA